ncbi:MAG: AAA family ATPase [Saprospiraceae bacterium]
MQQSPFKLFDPYGSSDKNLFFGRDAEIYALSNLLQQTRLVLVYGASGTGKTSLLQAGLPKVFKLSDWFCVSIRRRDNLNEAFRAELARLCEAPVTDLAVGIEAVYNTRWVPLYLVFDQFEELFTLGNHAERLQFFQDIQSLLDRPLPCKIILSMREEYIGHLYEYESLTPALFDKRFRVEPMKDQTILNVITRTCEAHQVELAEGPVTAGQILEQVKEEKKQAVHLPYLQVYLHYLYENAILTTGLACFAEAGIQAVGKLGNVLKRFIETQLDDARRHFAAQGLPDEFAGLLLDEFATGEGTKQARRASELAEVLETDPARVEEALLYFSEKKLLRADENDVERYEPVHDVVAKQIHELRSAQDKEFKAFVRQLQNDCERWEADHFSVDRFLKENDLAKMELYLERIQRRSEYESKWRGFVEKSRAHNETLVRRKKRRQQISIAAAVLGFVLLGLAIFYYLKAVDVLKKNKEANCALYKANEEKRERYMLQAKQARRDVANFQRAGETINESLKHQYIQSLDSLIGDLNKKLLLPCDQ